MIAIVRGNSDQATRYLARSLRGGSWNNQANNARAAIRNNNDPDNRNNNIGFRLACSAHVPRLLSLVWAQAVQGEAVRRFAMENWTDGWLRWATAAVGSKNVGWSRLPERGEGEEQRGIVWSARMPQGTAQIRAALAYGIYKNWGAAWRKLVVPALFPPSL